MTTDNLDPNVTQPRKRTRSRRARVTVELNKYKTLIDALEDRHRVRRVVLTVFALGMLLFIGISLITLSIKRLYPYSDITTNGLGATTIKSEKNEVTYWLFNTATLWANSGIHVDKGDIIMIRASGKSNTAIHHLYKATKDNSETASPEKDSYHEWIGCEGLPLDKETGRGKERRKYRIFPDMPSGALLMQVSNGTPKDTPLSEGAEPKNFYFIGKERQHIYINEGGDLYFAVNDIVLNRPTIAKMMWETICEKYNNDLSGFISIIQSYYNDGKYGEKLNQYLKQNNIRKIEELIEKDKDLRKAIKKTFDTVFEEKVDSARQVYAFLNPSHFSSEQSFLDVANTMCTIIRKECNNGTIKDVLNKHWTQPKDSARYNSFINRICTDSCFQLTDINSIKELDTIKTIFDALRKIKKEDLLPTIGKMKLGYTSLEDNSLVCELSYYYGDVSLGEDNKKRKAIWFEDNIGSFLIVIEKTKK